MSLELINIFRIIKNNYFWFKYLINLILKKGCLYYIQYTYNIDYIPIIIGMADTNFEGFLSSKNNNIL